MSKKKPIPDLCGALLASLKEADSEIRAQAESKTFAQSMAEVAARLPVDEEAEGEILRFMRENGVENPVRLELPEPNRDEALPKHPCSERCWRIGYQPVDVPPGEPCPECGQPWPTKARRAPPTAVRPALEQLFAAELDAMEQLLAANLGPNGDLVREERGSKHHGRKAQSHLERGFFGPQIDQDSGLHHYIHAATRLLFALRALRMGSK